MTNAPCAEIVRGGESLSRLANAVEVIAEWGFGHAAQCTQVGYGAQATLYPPQVLEVHRLSAHTDGMAISLRDARKRVGLSQEALGLKAGSGRSTIVKLEKGELPLTEAWARRLAPHLDVRPSDLWTPPQVRVIGFVGAGARVYAYDDMLDAGDTIDRPPIAQGDLLAVQVKGDSMLPLAEEGWHIVYTAEATVDENEVLNRVCVVQLDEDESMMVKRVLRGTKPYHYHLASLNAPLIPDVRLRWAAVVKAIVPQ
jgi:phage repressor protein C with HTH and peptisase S24 domain